MPNRIKMVETTALPGVGQYDKDQEYMVDDELAHTLITRGHAKMVQATKPPQQQPAANNGKKA